MSEGRRMQRAVKGGNSLPARVAAVWMNRLPTLVVALTNPIRTGCSSPQGWGGGCKAEANVCVG